MLATNPHRLAWATLLGALAVFVLLCGGTVAFARWLVFESPTQLNVTLYVGRGTVGLAEPDTTGEQAIRGNAAVGRDDTLRTDSNSQGYLSFSDPYSGEIVATVLLRKDSVATLRTANRPRFNLSNNPAVIRLSGINGRLEVWVNNDLEREIRIEIESPLGTTRIGETGNFWIDSTPGSLKVTSRVGSATLVASDRHAQHLAASTEGTIQAGNPAITVSPAPIDLLPNWDFDQAQDWPIGWSCTWDPSPENQDGPRGEFEFSKVDGRGAVHIIRMQPDPGPGTNRCVQYPGGSGGLDVSGYESLRLRVTMQIHHQSLSACGSLGTECPVMLYIQYWDQDGNPDRVWLHGFFTDYTPNVGRRICDQCWEDHEQINKDAWYTYETGNLFTDWAQDRRPSAIEFIEFYADGHQYDVMLSEVALIAAPRQPDIAAAP